MSDHALHRPTVEFKHANLPVVVVVVRDVNPLRLADALHTMMGGMPDVFSGDAAVLDMTAISGVCDNVDWTSILALLRRYQLQPSAVIGLDPGLVIGALRAGLAILPPDAFNLSPPVVFAQSETEVVAPAPEAVEPPLAHTMIVDRPVRSGQQVYAKGGDLILLEGASDSAEVIADGSIHCYGPLRGRIIAGARGDLSARIYTIALDPKLQLVSIGGIYRTFENGPPAELLKRPVQIRLVASGEQQVLAVEPFQVSTN
jgi:septum site-determining protein MinC